MVGVFQEVAGASVGGNDAIAAMKRGVPWHKDKLRERGRDRRVGWGVRRCLDFILCLVVARVWTRELDGCEGWTVGKLRWGPCRRRLMG